MSKYAVIGFLVIVFGSVFTGCNTPPIVPEPDPVEVLSVDISPVSGTPTLLTASVYATGTGRIEIKWFNKTDTTGYQKIHSNFVYVDGEDTYSTQYNSGTALTDYVQAVVYDSIGNELLTSTEIFYGDGPTSAPILSDLTATPISGLPPLEVRFYYENLIPYGDDTYFIMDYTGDGNYSHAYTTHTYDSIGTYTATLICANQWGADTAYLQDPIVIVNPDPEIDSITACLNGSSGYNWEFDIYCDLSTTGIDSQDGFYTWLYFGDGDSARVNGYPFWNVYHIYEAPGSYTVTGIAINDWGSDTLIVPDLIVIEE